MKDMNIPDKRIRSQVQDRNHRSQSRPHSETRNTITCRTERGQGTDTVDGTRKVDIDVGAKDGIGALTLFERVGGVGRDAAFGNVLSRGGRAGKCGREGAEGGEGEGKVAHRGCFGRCLGERVQMWVVGGRVVWMVV